MTASDTRIEPVRLRDKLETFDELWAPRIVATYNGNDVMIVKVEGPFVWHAHPDTDDFFLVLQGGLTIETSEGTVNLGPGDLYVVPKGIEHRPSAAEETHILIIEPSGTPNTGDEATAADKPWV